ncbi:GNAT family N-acetyltransferase [Phycicoccus flavus]|uniref:GNAT family N-acetyltransferase n=1 Tax=Phycicoccus flavus TaxID=2502783 RepID=UPI000FEBF6B0|nr:GNAT family N-acetyltransferase [Phycicoccus flavus]NHA69917.1 GNAT family N-acetyltransferase [Phycicoccus flavus]
MAATIRPRIDDDLPALAKVLVEVHAADGYPVEGVDDPLAWLDLPNALGAWTAELDWQPVGHVAMSEPGPDDQAPRLLPEAHNSRDAAVLGRLFVSPVSRCRGIAEALIRTVMRASADADRRLVLDVMVKDAAAIHLYERLGWVRLGNFKHSDDRGSSVPAIAMAAPTAVAS